jgi:hypothetical protein
MCYRDLRADEVPGEGQELPDQGMVCLAIVGIKVRKAHTRKVRISLENFRIMCAGDCCAFDNWDEGWKTAAKMQKTGCYSFCTVIMVS